SVVIFFPLLTRGQFIRGVFANVILATAFAYLQTQQPAFQKAVMDSLLLFSAVTVVALATFAKETAERHAFIEKHRAELEAVRSYSLLLNAISPASAEELLSAGERSASDNVQACVVFLEFTLPAADHADVPHGVPDLNLMTSESAMRHGLAITRTSPFSYMLVALSGANEKESVMRSAEFCLALSKTFNDRMIHAGPSTFRAGICAGSIRTAMVEGRHAYYDFEDKTMTMASGLMMRALPRRVLVCRETYQILKSDFELEESHNVYVEHVGHVPAYVLLAKRS
ncbi:MAG: hypothetical protein HY042_00415, partial [Spirochaetia bacterium]|nr:hypothetical protein [Spirochaetia bacterium]